jgi:GntR family transcriptional repressor for pyruvate dehydrogenase complex
MQANVNDPLDVESRPDLSQQLTRQLLKLIATRELRPGDRLPSMKELAQLFSVATPTIREAVRRLQATGVVDIRHGSGIYVRRVDQGLIIPNPHHVEMNADSVMQLLDSRLAIEPYLAGRAAELATDADLLALSTLLKDAEHLLTGHDTQLHPTNMRFHCQIARISRNMILAEFLESLVELYSREQFGILEIFNARTRDYRDHVSIFEAIRAHDPALATRRMKRHLIGVRDVVAQRLLSPKD